MAYELYYWPGIPGRGEFIRLALEEAGADYVDVVRLSERDGGGVPAMKAFLEGEDVVRSPFAPPFLKDRDIVVAQTSAILLYLGDRLGLAPKDEAGRLWTHQLQLTIADLVDDAHDTHHPVGSSRYYADQKPEAKRRAEEFREVRLPKFLAWFESVLARNPDGGAHLVGNTITYADLSLFQVIDGITFAFPIAMRREIGRAPRVARLHAAVPQRPRIRAYLASDRRLPYSDGIFRHYPELDG